MRDNRGRKREEDLRVERVVAHVTPDEKEKIVQAARECGMDTSTYIRTICIYKQFEKLCNKVVKEL